MRAYAIGDIHGHLDLLQIAHDRIAADRVATGDTTAPVIHIGDLVDRGPASPGVIDHLMHGIAQGAPWVVLKGNHDRMFSLWMQSPPARDHRLRPEYGWLHPRIGGADTLIAYGVRAALDRPEAPVHAEAQDRIPPAHLDFLANLPALHRHGDLLFAHAGIRPGVALADQTEDDLVWIRHDFLDDPRDHGPLVVHGHTAVERATHYGNRVNIDSSAAYGGPVTAVVFEGRDAWVLGPYGREPLLP
ncbi:serine/threonine protein phosphatase 1 [Gemmobacter megaterium]|uniref:Serine/threonine protein phosphatase 1 n=1 Tax=Gemmobacter megaterium TaxID=1086013 RepID=A0A1N7PEA4_9RHOB|nr:metallophosphoesterase [Gemmobacter megaterium]GGE18733.1 serine/threonine protein phosphatase [Gemmobacter megaterium]SIT08965.1 serine/threonine protein phosphatase 1 [Gemmobacter megaterium]